MKSTMKDTLQTVATWLAMALSIIGLGTVFVEGGKHAQLLADVSKEVQEIKGITLPAVETRLGNLERGGSSGLAQHEAMDNQRVETLRDRVAKLEDFREQLVRDLSDIKASQRVQIERLDNLQRLLDRKESHPDPL